MLRLSDLSRSFRVGGGFLPAKTLVAVDQVSFDVAPGEFFSLVGESGCGKSTLARIICGLDSATSGQMFIDGQPVAGPAAFKSMALRRKIQMVFQDPYSSLNPRMKIGDVLREPLVQFGWGDSAKVEARVAELISLIGFSRGDLERYPHQFSGGQRQRIAIARALAAGPELLVCDEPVSALDVSIKGQIINLLLDIQESLGVTILFISHDLSLVQKVSDKVGVMYLGKLVEVGTARELFDAPKHPYTRMLIDSIPSLDPSRRGREGAVIGEVPSPFAIPSGCRFHDRCLLAAPACTAAEPALEACGKSASHASACFRKDEVLAAV